MRRTTIAARASSTVRSWCARCRRPVRPAAAVRAVGHRRVKYRTGPGSQGNGSFGHWYVGQLGPNSELGDIPDIPVPAAEGLYYWIPAGEIAQDIEELVSFFEWLFGGSSAPPTPRQLLHGRHPLYPVILGIQIGLLPDEASAGELGRTRALARLCQGRPQSSGGISIWPESTELIRFIC